MRRRIRLTGRKQLKRSTVDVRLTQLPDRRLVTMTINDPQSLKAFPTESKISLRLYENKKVEVLEFGTLSRPRSSAEVSTAGFVKPTCQLRITDMSKERRSLLLGSTDSWTIKGDNDVEEEGRKGILLFQPGDTAPRSWRLAIQENDFPIVYVDKRIPDVRNWVKSDPVFMGTVLPAVLSQLFDDILAQSSAGDIEWVAKWVEWADAMMPGKKPPFSGDLVERRQFIDDLIDTFCDRHDLADKILRQLSPKESER